MEYPFLKDYYPVFSERGKLIKVMGYAAIMLTTCVFGSTANAEILPNNDLTRQEVAQQTKVVKGVVTDENGDPIIGANVIEVGTTNGTITDVDGKFTLNVSPKSTLRVSYIGYVSKDVPVGNQSNLNISLKENTQDLDEVVVVGYGVVRKADLAGSVSVLDNKSFKDQPIVQVSDALQGRVSGVNVQNSGVPGGTVKIRVRGSGSINRSNDPLYVVDGMVRESGLTGLNPEDIQSMQVLKDASSTAIYGSRGANGVILITTKQGTANNRQIMFDAKLGAGTVAKKYDTLNAYEFATLYNTYLAGTFSDTELANFKSGKAGTNWLDEIYRTGFTQDYKISLSGGNEKTQYLISGNYSDQQGVVIENNSVRYQGRVNLSSQFTDWFKVTTNINASRDVTHNSNFETGKSNIINIAMNYAPVITNTVDENGYYPTDSYSALTQRNPVGIIKEQMGEATVDIFNGSIDLKFNILPGLTFTTSNGVDYYDSRGYSFATKLVSTSNSMANSNTNSTTVQSTNNLTYMGKWNKHSLTATAVYEATSSVTKTLGVSGSNLLTESVGWWNVNMAASRSTSNAYSKWTLMSGVGRVMYNYDDRYMLTGTIRADGSSKFTNNKWGWFPSIAAAWMLGNEGFMKDQTAFQNFKVRASYGIIGSQAISPYETLGLMSQAMYAFGGTSQYTGYWVGQTVATPDLTWEKTYQLDLGIDFSTLNNRLTVSLDYFDKRTRDGLLKRTIPNYDGGGSYWINAAKINNKGLDITLDAAIIENKDFGWTSQFTGTYLKNKVVDLAGLDFVAGSNVAAGMLSTDGVSRVAVGQPIGAFYGYVWTGVEDNNDQFEDLNDDGVIDSSDRTFIGKATPDFTLGWNNSLRWKNWELNAFFTGSFGADRLNLVRYTGTSMTGDFAFITLKEYLNDNWAVTQNNPRYVSVSATSNKNQEAAGSTKYLEKANYLRLDNLSLSYNLPKSVVKFADLRLSFSCQNLFTITKYKGMDPAGVSFVSSSTGSVDINDGIDLGAYPLTRTYTFGVRMNF